MKKASIILFSFLFFTSMHLKAQNVGIGTSTPDASAALEVKSTDKGLLIPRLTSAARVLITTPAAGLMVYDITTKSFWYYNGTMWTNMNPEIIPALAKDPLQAISACF